MTPEELEQKLKAAALAKLTAETTKLTVETETLRNPPSGFSRFSSTVKEVLTLLIGLAGGIAGGWAVWTGIELAEAKKALVEAETLKLELATKAARRSLDSLIARNDTLKRKSEEYSRVLNTTQQEVAELDKRAPNIKLALGASRTLVQASGLPAGQIAQLEQQLTIIEQNLKKTNEAAGYISTDLATALGQSPTAQQGPSNPQAVAATVQGLFASSTQARNQSYQNLRATYNSAPTLVTELLAMARKEPQNLNGLYNALVVLNQLSLSVLKPQAQDILQFAREVRGKDRPRINKQSDSLQIRLGKYSTY